MQPGRAQRIRNHPVARWLVLAAGIFVSTALGADKSVYSLANPTPDALRREMSTDRPDATEGPFTVDAGRLQLEFDLVSRTSDEADGGRRTAWAVAPFNLRVGIKENLELGIFLTPWTRQSERNGAALERRTGAGDTTLRAKLNFGGNDGGAFASGLIVDAKLPTAARGLGNGAVEGTVLFPISVELGGGWELGAMTGADFLRDDGGGREVAWIGTATVGHEIARNVDGYLEFVAEAGAGAPVTTCDAGLTWQVNEDTQFDVGVERGLSNAADDVRWFSGVSRRF